MKHPITIILLFFSFSISAQFNTLSNERVYGGDGDDAFLRKLQVNNSDNSFVICSSNSDASFDKSEDSRGDYDLWLLKLDNFNNIIWEKTIGGIGQERNIDGLFFDNKLYVILNSDSNVSGDKTVPNYGDFDNWIICLDTNGIILWQNIYGGIDFENYGQLLGLENGNILLACSSSSGVSGNRTVQSKGNINDILLMEINPVTGNLITQNAIGTGTAVSLNDIVQLENGNLIILANAFTGIGVDKSDIGYGSYDNWVIKLDSQYNKLMDKCFGGSNVEAEFGASILKTADELYFILSSSSPISGNKTAMNHGSIGTSDCWVVKTNLDLETIWDNTYGGSGEDVAGFSSHDYQSGDLVIKAFSKSGVSGNKTSINFGQFDSWFINISESGSILRQQSVGGSQDEFGWFYNKSNGKKTYASSSYSSVSGMKTLPSKGGSDIWLFDFEDSDILDVPVVYNEQGVGTYPNPFEHQITFSIPENHEDLMLTIYTLDGKMVCETIILQNETVKNVEIEAKGVLMYKLQGATTSFTGKLISVN